VSIDEIRNLVKQEKEMEQKRKDAEEQAARIIENAKAKARQLLQEAENPEYYEDIVTAKTKEIEQKKKQAEKEINDKIRQYPKKAEENMEKTVSKIVAYVLDEEF
jgi:F0F1-type ATP synthase membrane subunit b/b'